MAQFVENVWFCKIGEKGVSTFANRMMTPGILCSHHDHKDQIDKKSRGRAENMRRVVC